MITTGILLLIALFIIVFARSKKDSNLGLSLLFSLGLGVVIGLGVNAYHSFKTNENVKISKVEKVNAQLPMQSTYSFVLETNGYCQPGIASQVQQLSILSLLNYNFPIAMISPIGDLVAKTHIFDSS